MAHIGVTPPSCNTGAQIPSREGLNPLVDWVGATFKNVKPDDLISDILLMNPADFVELERGKYGYMSAKQLGHITVLYNGHKDMGIHLEFSGQGCREFESYGIMDWQTLFRVMLHCEAKFTRVDVSMDDYKGYFTLNQVIRKVKAGELVSKFKNAVRMEKMRIEDGKTVGHTVYFGSESSRIKIRMYDKLLEQMSEENADLSELEGLTVWNRTEIQARDERAHAIAALIADDMPLGDIVMGILKHYLRFVVKGKDKKKSRWKTAPFWEKFLRDIEGLRLATKKPSVTIEKKYKWLERQVAPTIAMIIDAFDGDMATIYSLINNGVKRLKPRDKALIAEFKLKNQPINSISQKEAI